MVVHSSSPSTPGAPTVKDRAERRRARLEQAKSTQKKRRLSDASLLSKLPDTSIYRCVMEVIHILSIVHPERDKLSDATLQSLWELTGTRRTALTREQVLRLEDAVHDLEAQVPRLFRTHPSSLKARAADYLDVDLLLAVLGRLARSAPAAVGPLLKLHNNLGRFHDPASRRTTV